MSNSDKHLSNPKGSIWRRWDLHLHTPNTKLSNGYACEGNVWKKFVTELEGSSVEAFGITDYFSADGYFNCIEQFNTFYPNSHKVFFPNIEFRLVEAISGPNSNPHIHVIFDNDSEKCSKILLTKFLSDLKTSATDQNGVKISCNDLKTESDFKSATIAFDNLLDSLKNVFGESTPYIIAFPAKNDGIKSTDSKSPRKVLVSDKLDKGSDIFFGGSDSQDWFLSENRYESGKSKPKPVVSCSDSHNFNELERLEGNVAKFEPTWIKSDLTFRGLTQICFEPEHRVYIGSEPDVEVRKVNEATKFLATLKVNQSADYDDKNGVWFRDVEIPLNPELVVIIGNKGSGKSAIVDIIGLLGDSRQEDYFSFLTNKGTNKKFRQRGYAENFQAELIWESGFKSRKKLSDNIDRSNPESVRYLPQNYFEQLTNEIEIEIFRKEIEDVVFSHVDETDRMDKDTFEELQEFKTHQSKQAAGSFIQSLKDTNRQIIDLENQASPVYKNELQGKLESKQKELESIQSAEPATVSKPDQQSDDQVKLTEQLDALNDQKDILESTESKYIERLTHAKERNQKLNSLLEKLTHLNANVADQVNELKPLCTDLGIDIEKIVSHKTDSSPIDIDIKAEQSKIASLEKVDEISFSVDTDLAALDSLPNVRAGIQFVEARIADLKQLLDSPELKYQKYVDRLSGWNKRKLEIIGDPENPAKDTINYLKAKIDYIETNLENALNKEYMGRKGLVEHIFNSKLQMLTFYFDLKASVDQKLTKIKTNGFFIEIDASFVIDRFFSENFLSRVTKNRKGIFHGSNDPAKLIRQYLSDTKWNDFYSIYEFFDTLLADMQMYDGQPIRIEDQVSEIDEFYDFLFSLDYLQPRYELRLGGKNLNELSPGEKGLLLLVFYLQLDKNNNPLIIDQPEDNLDNDSIFAVLAECIRQAKKHRQVVLVTHNPNLAVGADAEQIIYLKLDKAGNYKFSFETGAIENEQMNKRIVDVLEGSQPAFVKRRLKYQI